MDVVDPRRLRKDLEGWWCTGQMSIDDEPDPDDSTQTPEEDM
jgi:hypothetical protein